MRTLVGIMIVFWGVVAAAALITSLFLFKPGIGDKFYMSGALWIFIISLVTTLTLIYADKNIK